MKKIVLGILLVLNTVVNAQKFNGNWIGIGNQIDGKSWDIFLNYQNENNINISYPSLDCSGNWTLKRSDKKTSIFKEQIIEGSNKCDQGVEVHLQHLNKKTLKVLFYLREYDPKNPIAEGILYRQINK